VIRLPHAGEGYFHLIRSSRPPSPLSVDTEVSVNPRRGNNSMHSFYMNHELQPVSPIGLEGTLDSEQSLDDVMKRMSLSLWLTSMGDQLPTWTSNDGSLVLSSFGNGNPSLLLHGIGEQCGMLTVQKLFRNAGTRYELLVMFMAVTHNKLGFS
jgi:hypothetical protein